MDRYWALGCCAGARAQMTHFPSHFSQRRPMGIPACFRHMMRSGWWRAIGEERAEGSGKEEARGGLPIPGRRPVKASAFSFFAAAVARPSPPLVLWGFALHHRPGAGNDPFNPLRRLTSQRCVCH